MPASHTVRARARRQIPLALLVTGSIFLPFVAAAIDLVSQDRSIRAYAVLQPSFGPPLAEDDVSQVAPDFSPFIESVAAAAGFAFSSAEQDSTIDLVSASNLSVSATGGSTSTSWNQLGEPALGSTNGRSDFEIIFQLDSPLPVVLSMSVLGSSLDSDPFAQPGRMSASIQLLDSSNGVLAELVQSSTSGPPTSFDENDAFSGVLGPGTYVLRASATSRAVGDQYFPDYSHAQASFALSFSIVPEPSTGLLLGFALVALGMRRRPARDSEAT